MTHPGRNKDLLTDRRVQNLTLEGELDLPFDQHEQFIGSMYIIPPFIGSMYIIPPYLARGIGPDRSAISPRSPIVLDI
jgi:hypothetical protein